MGKKISAPFAFYYRFHRFNYVGIRAAFYLTRAEQRFFYQLRNTAVLVNSVLSCLLYLSIVLSFYVFLFPARIHYPGIMLSLLASNILFLLLLRREREERLRNTLKPFSIHNINIGSAKTLRGNVSILHLFVDGRKRKRRWNERQVTDALKSAERAASWITKEAQRFKIDLNIEHKVLSDTRVQFDNEIPEAANGYKSLEVFHERIESALRNAIELKVSSENRNEQNVCLVVHVLKHIRSFAVPDYLGTKRGEKSLEYCVIAHRESPSTYAHELLHLFGADDYYTEYSKMMERLKSEFVAKSIMFSGGQSPLEHLTIDDLTAQNIGWL